MADLPTRPKAGKREESKMEGLNKMGRAGLSYFDLNMEFFEEIKWEDTPLGERKSWCQPLVSFVNLLATLPHPAAIFWGKDFTVAHNLAWAEALQTEKKQGTVAKDSYDGEVISCLHSAMRGRTVKAASQIFLSNTPDYSQDAQVLLSSVLGDGGERSGIFAQLVEIPATEGENAPGFDDDASEEDEAEDVVDGESGQQDLTEEGSENEDDQTNNKTPTKEDDEEYDKQKEAEGKDPNKPTKTDSGEGQSTYANDKPTKKPILKHGNLQLDLRKNRLFRRFAAMIPTGLAILDKEAEALFVNDNFFSLTTNRSHKSYRAWPETIAPEDVDRVMSEYRDAFSNRQEMRTEFRCVPIEGQEPQKEPWRLFLMKPLNDEPDVGGFIVAVVDISEMKAAELSQQRAAQEAKDRKEQQERFVDMISHEIRNPLSAILHSSEEIRDSIKQLDQDSDLVTGLMDATDTILLCVAHQSSLVDEILQFSKLDAAMLTLSPKIAQPKWDLSETLKLFQAELRAKEIKFSYAMDVSFDELKVGYVLADLKRIKQVLVNLMTNAIKFTAKAKGERHISVAMGASKERPDSYPPSVCFFSSPTGTTLDATLDSSWGDNEAFYLMVAVKDSGIGITEEGQAKLFERFNQATPKTQEKYGGSGLGLFISRKLCQLHGGDIGVASKYGVGSTFGFFFRVKRSDRPADADSDEESDVESLADTASKDVAARERASTLQSENNGEEFDQPHLRDVKPPKRINNKDMPESLINPPTEFREEAHPGISTDERHNVTTKVAERVSSSERDSADEKECRAEKALSSIKDSKTTNGASPKHKSKERTSTASASAADGTSTKSKSQEGTSSTSSGTSAPSEPISDGKNVLLAEDNIINQKVLKRQLQAKGYNVTPANNGRDAVAVIENAIKDHNDQSSSEENTILTPAPFDIILMDQEMPYLTGNQATRKIRQLEEDGKVAPHSILGVSANVREEQKKEMIEAGMNDVITKPFKVDDLVKKIKGLIDRIDEDDV